MSGWVAGALVVGAVGSAYIGSQSAEASAEAGLEAANIQAGAEQEALDYLKETEALPQAVREQALTGLSEYYQVPGQPSTQDQLIQQGKESPLYASIMGTQQAGEEALLRTSSATGGLRSGGAIAGLTDYSMQLENQALLESFNQAQSREDYERGLNLSGLGALAQLPSGASEIADLTATVGATQAQGVTAAAQAEQAGTQNIINSTLGFTEIAAGWYSDIRLKENVEFINIRNGLPWFKWDWIDAAGQLDLYGSDEGYMAHHVYMTHPEAVMESDGFLKVNYDMLEAA